MSTAGHFVSMLGVFCFYSTLLESSFERKLTPLTHNLVPRVYVDSTVIQKKKVNVKLKKRKKINLLSKRARMFLNKKIR